MRKFFITAVVLLLIVPPVHAQETDLSGPGILPTSPWYRIELFFEQIGELIILDKTARAERLLMHAEERLAEIKALAEQEHVEELEALLAEYRSKLQEAEQLVEEEQHEGKNVDESLTKVSEATLRHQAVLAEVYDKVPDTAKPAIERAMERSMQGHERATEAVSAEKKEEVQQQVEETRQHVEERLNILREEGKPIPSITIPRGRPDTIPPEERGNQENRGQEQSNAEVKPLPPVQTQQVIELPDKVEQKVDTPRGRLFGDTL